MTDYSQYWQNRIAHGKTTLRPRHREIIRLVKSLQPSGSVLEIGCGEGHTLQGLADQFQCVGVDISSEALSLITDPRIEKIQADLKQKLLDLFPVDRQFDFIIASEILEHLTDIDARLVLSEAYYLLKDPGTLIITIPNIYYWEYIIARLQGKYPYDLSHLSFWSLWGFHQILHETGYTVTALYPTQIAYPFNKYTRRILPRLPYGKYLFGEDGLYICRKKGTS